MKNKLLPDADRIKMNVSMKNVLELISVFTIILMSSCAAMSQKHKDNSVTYYEDLSTARPAYINPDTLTNSNQAPKKTAVTTFSYDDNKRVAARIDSLTEMNRRIATVQGFRILVYTGSSSDESQRIKQQVYTFDSQLNVYTQYKQPSFRVKVGDFPDRVAASYILNDLKRSFPNAMIVPDQINLVR
ncbi:conserved hypothetical protein [Cytophaga hutchinsonii ATCC 33406]|uniref:SPOR domain-containing protein n=2 Tax=Cytophaga hutchinsonii TaxID=985 RepID=A0A6N4SMD1_CYTH3|nr:conserved hypothetical protein [Cytophaga hutchinsonii ATCC 33406]SFX97882.1 Sporulation related domain-containing protein [Cytophaga hutchinsonii ATCC 33406]